MKQKLNQIPLLQNRNFLLIILAICSLSFIPILQFRQEINPQFKSIYSTPIGYWMSKNKRTGYLFSKNHYFIEYERVSKARVNSRSFAYDYIPSLRDFRVRISDDTIFTHSKIIKFTSLNKDTLILNITNLNIYDTLTKSKDQTTPVYVECLRRYIGISTP